MEIEILYEDEYCVVQMATIWETKSYISRKRWASRGFIPIDSDGMQQRFIAVIHKIRDDSDEHYNADIASLLPVPCLSNKENKALRLRYEKGLKYKDIAKQCEISESRARDICVNTKGLRIDRRYEQERD